MKCSKILKGTDDTRRGLSATGRTIIRVKNRVEITTKNVRLNRGEISEEINLGDPFIDGVTFITNVGAGDPIGGETPTGTTV